ncbi:hypothetical protein WEH80_04670 [Actinomycetes bacterium KLBMP 9759]
MTALRQPTDPDPSALTATAGVLREVAAYDQRTDDRRADVSYAQADLLEACARRLADLPDDVTRHAMRVAAAVDRATGQRR